MLLGSDEVGLSDGDADGLLSEGDTVREADIQVFAT
jgi:hypothetical protein